MRQCAELLKTPVRSKTFSRFIVFPPFLQVDIMAPTGCTRTECLRREPARFERRLRISPQRGGPSASAIAESLAASGLTRPGAVYRAAREAQGPFVSDLRAETSSVPRHHGLRASNH